MTCNCGNEKVVVRHVRGNTLTLAIPLQERIRRMVDDEETVETVDYNPLPTDVVTVNLRGFTRTVTFSGTDVTITGNVVEVTDKGTLGAGTYGVEILIDSADGKKRRYYSASEIQVVEQTSDAGIDEGTEYDVTTRTLEAAVFDIMRGYSAYEIWLQQGHQGTEADFLEWLRDDSMAGEYIDNEDTLVLYMAEWGTCNILKNPVKQINLSTKGISEAGAAQSTLIFKAAANLRLTIINGVNTTTIQQGSPKFIEGNTYVMHFVGVRNEEDTTTHVVCWFDSKMATVAYTGSYNDLEDKPTIPVLPELARVATSGQWSDLTGRPMKDVYAYTELDSLKDEGWYGIERTDGDSASYRTKYPMELLLVTFDQFKAGVDALNVVTQTLICWDGHIRQRKWNRNAWGAWVDVLSTAAYSGSYEDLTDKPTIPDVTGKEDSLEAVAVDNDATATAENPYSLQPSYGHYYELANAVTGLNINIPYIGTPSVENDAYVKAFEVGFTAGRDLSSIRYSAGGPVTVDFAQPEYVDGERYLLRCEAYRDGMRTIAHVTCEKAVLSDAAYTGRYGDLTDKPIRLINSLSELDGDGWYIGAENELLWATYDETNDRYAATVFLMDWTLGLSIIFGVVSDGVFSENYSVPMGAVNDHLFNTVVHITAAERTAWNGKYTKPSTGIPASDLEEGVIPNISGKEDKVAIATALPATLEAGKYYRLGTVGTLSAALPTVSDTEHAASIMIGLTASADITPALTSSASVYYQEGFEIKSGGVYEINCLWNGSYWSVTEIKFETA